MNSKECKTCLIVIYNHNFEHNINIVRKLYKERFRHIIQIMPFYSGNDEDVIKVFGNSFYFHSYIAQSKRIISEIDCDRYLFIGDDLILNPAVNQQNIESILHLSPDDCFFPGFNDVSKGEYVRGTMEAHNFKLHPAGIDSNVIDRLPSVDEAFKILHNKGLMESMNLTKVTPFLPAFKSPFFSNLYENYKILRARAWHYRNSLRYCFGSFIASYPTVFGYSDIFSLPKSKLDDFCNMLEIFSSVQMFVELAIPTTFALHNWNIVHEDDLELKPLNVWFPQDPKLFDLKNKIINKLENETNCKIDNLAQHFPKEYLYMHPVKLSKWS